MKRKVEINLDEVQQVFLVLEKFQQYFHQPLHYPDIEAVRKFLGDRDAGAFKEINDVYYDVVWNWLPDDIKQELEERDSGSS